MSLVREQFVQGMGIVFVRLRSTNEKVTFASADGLIQDRSDVCSSDISHIDVGLCILSIS